MILKKFISLSLLIFLWSFVTTAQGVQLELLTENDGLSASQIIDMVEDEDGLLWVATSRGLNRYDGKQFIQLDNLDSKSNFSEHPIEQMIFEKNILWFFQKNNWLTQLDLNSGEWISKNQNDWKVIPTPSKNIAPDSIFTTIEQAENFSSIFQNLDALKNTLAVFLFSNEKNIWWSGAERQLFFLDKNKNVLFDYSENLKNLATQPIKITKFFSGKNGIVWAASNLGLLKIRHPNSLFDTYLVGGNSYCGNGSGNCSMRGIAEDKSGNIYFSHYNSIHVLNPQNNDLQPLLPAQKNFNQPFDLIFFENFIWTNSSKRIRLSDKNISTVLPPNQAKNQDIGNFMVDQSGKLWLGRENNLWVYQSDNQSFTPYNSWNTSNKSEITFLLQSDDKHYFWVGTREDGLLKINYNDGLVTTYNPNNSGLKSNYARVMFEEEISTLWIGTQGGLYEMDIQKNTFHRYTREDGLPHDVVNSILPQGDSVLWLGTDLGLSRFHKKNKTFINFFVEDGLPDNELARISFHQAQNGRMYFGSLNGVIAFFPEEVMAAYQKQQTASQIVMTAFIKQNNDGDTTALQLWNKTTDEIDLYHFDKNYIFEFVLTDFRQPNDIFYSFKMEGNDPDWSIPSKINTARYSNLSPGNYTLHVKARDAKGGWHPQSFQLHIQVHPPWWSTNFAYTIYVIVLLGISYLVYRFLTNRLILKSRLEFQQQEAGRLKELDAFKTKLYANITHEFRTPLTVILGMSDEIEDNLENISKEKIQSNLQLINRNGNNLLLLVNQMLDLSKVESNNMQLQWVQGDLIQFLKYITESFDSFAASQNVSLTFKSSVEELWMDYDVDKFLKIISNLLSNAIKFTPEGGKVQLNASHDKQHHQLILNVADTGIGIPKNQLPLIFERFYQAESKEHFAGGTGIGLSLTQELVKLFDGTISVKSQEGMGTTFTILLPIHQNAQPAEMLGEKSPLRKIIEAYTFSTPKKIAPVEEVFEENATERPTLLIIEDNPDVVIYLKSILEKKYQLDIADNGQTGIEKATEAIPDIIISDVMMPQKNGFEVTDVLKNDERTSHIPIILLTAKADVDSKLQGLRRGADAYIAKPFDKQELLVRLKALVVFRKKMQARYANLDLPEPTDEAIKMEDAFLKKLRTIVEENMENPQFGIEQLCRKVHLSRMQVHRKLKALTDKPASHFIRSIRLAKGKELIRTTDMTISEVAYEVGFNDPNYFSRLFSQEYGMTPSQFLQEKRKG